MIKSAKGS